MLLLIEEIFWFLGNVYSSGLFMIKLGKFKVTILGNGRQWWFWYFAHCFRKDLMTRLLFWPALHILVVLLQAAAAELLWSDEGSRHLVECWNIKNPIDGHIYFDFILRRTWSLPIRRLSFDYLPWLRQLPLFRTGSTIEALHLIQRSVMVALTSVRCCQIKFLMYRVLCVHQSGSRH